jgi:hypothetical protein
MGGQSSAVRPDLQLISLAGWEILAIEPRQIGEDVVMSLGLKMVRLFSRGEFYRLIEQGFFRQQRVELIEGEIVRMAQQKGPHFAAIWLVDAALREAFGPGFWVRTQGPLHLLKRSAPVPDNSVVTGSVHDYPHHPTSAELIVEVKRFDIVVRSRPQRQLVRQGEDCRLLDSQSGEPPS